MALGTRPRRDLGVIAGVLAAAALVYPGALFRGEAFFARDLHLDWYPRLLVLARCLRAGSWPLWDPSIGFGHPLLGDPGTQAAYPLAWPSLFVPLPAAYTVFVLLHLLVAALGAERLARRLGAGRIGSPAAAALFVLSGPLQSSIDLWHHFAGACWMPWVILAAGRAAQRRDSRGAAGLALAAGVQLLAGSADLCAMTWLIALGWAACCARPLRQRRRALAAAGALVAGAALAAGTGAVAWLPAAELLSRSARRDLPADVRGAWAVPAAGLLRIVAPLDPARVAYEPGRWLRLYDRREGPLLDSLYVGVAALTLALLPLAARRLARRGAFLLGCAVATAVFAMGPHGPLYEPLTAALFPLRVFRYPSKAMLPFALAVALAAGLGLATIARRRASGRWLVALAALAALGGIATARAASSLQSWPVLPLFALASAALLALVRLRRLDGRLAAVVLAVSCAAELLAADASLNPTAPAAAFFEPPPAVAQVDSREGRRLYVYDYHTIPGTSARLLGRPDPYRSADPPPAVEPRVFEAAALRLYLPPPSAGFYGLEGSYDLDIRGLFPRDLNDLDYYLRLVEGTPVHLKLLRMGAVGTVLSLHRAGLEELRPAGALPSLFPEPILVWRVPGALPRAWVVGCARVADRGDAFRALADPGFDPAREVILPAPAGTVGECAEAGSATVASLRPDRIRIEATAPRGGYLVLADAWDPGWRVTVDGQAAPLLRANVAFRGVALPPGAHRVEWLYRPAPATAGALLSLLSLAAIGLAAAQRRRLAPARQLSRGRVDPALPGRS